MANKEDHLIKAATGAVVAGLVAGAGYAGYQLHCWSSHWDDAVEKGARYPDSPTDIAPELLQWREVTRFQTGLTSVKSFAILEQGTVLVAGERKLRLLSSEGKLLRDIPLDAIPEAVTAINTPDGLLFCAAMKDRVETFDADGTPRHRWQAPGDGAFLTCLAPGATGRTLWVADAGRRVVYETDLYGKVLREIGRADPSTHAPGLVVPSAHLDVVAPKGGATSGGDELIWINNPGRHELEAYDAQGVMVRQWGEAGPGIGRFFGCCNPTDFFMLPDGRTVTAEKGIPRVKVFDATGRLQSVITTDFAKEAAGIDVAADTAGRVWILDPASRELRIYAPKQMEVAANELH